MGATTSLRARSLLAAITATLLVAGVAAAADMVGTVAPPGTAPGARASAERAASTSRSPAGSVPWNVAPGATFHGTKAEKSPAEVQAVRVHPGMFNVERDRPRVDDLLTTQLREVVPAGVLRVLVHAASSEQASAAAERSGLRVLTTFDKVGVAVAAGPARAVRAVTETKGVSFVEADRELTYAMETSNGATRASEARKGFDVTYLEPQPDKPATSKKVCKTKRVKNEKTGKVRRVRRCRTTSTPPQPQPPITRTAHSAGVDGSGVTIGIIDSGADRTHPMFRLSDGSSKVVRNLKYAGPSVPPWPCGVTTCGDVPLPGQPEQYPASEGRYLQVDDSDALAAGGGHGTHVSGIAAGVDVVTNAGEQLHGAAPGAKLVVLGHGLSVFVADFAVAMDWVLAHHADPCGDGSCPPIRVVNNSYGGSGEFDPEYGAAKLQRALVSEGVVMVWAAGNGGGDGSTSVTNFLANDPETPGIISVANYADADNGTRTGGLDLSSSRGQKGEPDTYPDLAAPGSAITSACRIHLTDCNAGTAEPDYGTIGGTSMAAPNVAGIVALLFEVNPALTPAQVEDILEDTAHPFPLGASYEPDPANPGTLTSYDRGHGLVDAAAAVARARAFPAEPAEPVTCTQSDASVVDPPGDVNDLSITRGMIDRTAYDLLATRLSWDGTSGLTFATRVADLPAEGAMVSSLDVQFMRGQRLYMAHAERSPAGTAFVLGDSSGLAVTEGVSGSFDADRDEIVITVTNAAFAVAGAAPLASGEYVQVTEALLLPTIEPATLVLLGGDWAHATCPYRLGAGTAVPPPHTSLGPDLTPPTLTPKATLSVGRRWEWDAGPYTMAAGLLCRRLGLSEDCYVTQPVQLEVPPGGAWFSVVVTPDSPLADFDVAVFAPGGKVIGRSANAPLIGDPASAERVEVGVTVTGVYTIVVTANTTVNSTYHGTASLGGPPGWRLTQAS